MRSPPCPSISFNVVGGVQGESFGHLTVTLCNAFGARTSFSLWSENNGFLTKLGDPTSWSRSVVGEGDPNLWDSRITYGLTEEQYGQAALLAAEHNRQYREHHLHAISLSLIPYRSLPPTALNSPWIMPTS